MMGLEDFASPQAAILAGATAALMSERGRGVLRRGVVYGVAGVLTVADVATGAARGVAHGVGGDGGSGQDGGGPPEPAASEQRAGPPAAPPAPGVTP